MAKMAIGYDDDGPFLKITGDAFDPRSEPDENYASFRFNSRYAEIGYFDETRIASYSNSNNSANYQSENGGGIGVALSPLGIPVGALGAAATGGFNTTSNQYVFVSYGIFHYRFHDGIVLNHKYNSNGKTAYDYPTIADYYLTSGGWNYPNFWRSVNYTSGGGNEWGSIAYVEMIRRIENPQQYYNGVTGPMSSWTVRPTLLGGLSGFNVKFVITPLPADNSPLPFAEATQVEGHRVISIDETAIKIARKGFDVRTATDDQLIIGGSSARMPVYVARRVSIANGQTINITLPSLVPTNAVVLMQWNIQGQARRLPSIWVGSTASGVQYEIRWKISGGVLTIQNLAPFSYDLVFMVTSTVLTDPQGGPAIRQGVDGGEKFISIVQADGTIGADSRSSYLPIIKTGVANANANGAGEAIVNFPDQGYIPFVWYSYHFLRNGYDAFMGPRYLTNRYNQQDCISNTATITSSKVKFESYAASPYLLGSTKPYSTVAKYFRYYVFAIPDVQSS